jgi:hypothetical protein
MQLEPSDDVSTEPPPSEPTPRYFPRDAVWLFFQSTVHDYLLSRLAESVAKWHSGKVYSIILLLFHRRNVIRTCVRLLTHVALCSKK